MALDLVQKYKDIISGAGNLLSTAVNSDIGQRVLWGAKPIQPITKGYAQGVVDNVTPYAKLLGEASYQANRFVFDKPYRKAILNQPLNEQELQQLQKRPDTKLMSPEQLHSRGNIIASGGAATGKALLSTYGFANPANAATTAAVSGVLDYGISRLQGKDNKEALYNAGRSAGSSSTYAGINSLTNPIFDKVSAKVVPASMNFLQKGLIKGTVMGAGNAAESAIFTPLTEGRFASPKELLIAAGTGLGTGVINEASASAFNSVKNAVAKFNPKASPNELESITKEFIRDELGRFATQGSKKKEVKYASDIRESLGLPKYGDYQTPIGFQAKAMGPEQSAESQVNLYKNLISQGLTPEEIKTKYPKTNPYNNSDTQLAARGYTKEQVAQISPEEAQKIISDGIPPFAHDSYQAIANKKIKINGDSQSIEEANVQSAAMFDNVKSQFAEWVNNRKAASVEGFLKSKEFSNLDEQGIAGIMQFQSGDKTGELGNVKKYFDDKFQQLQKAGVSFNYKQDYLPQLWENSPEEVSAVFARNLTTKPSFTIDSIYKNYREGIAAGLTPKFQNISDLTSWYEKTANKAIADTNYFKNLARENMILPAGKAPREWVTLDPDRFPKIKVQMDDGQYTGIYKAPAELADMVNNYLKAPSFEALDKTAQYTSWVKNRVLSFGVPGTAINAHGVNIFVRNTLASNNPIVGAFTGFKYLVNPNAAERDLSKIIETAPAAVKNGLTFSIEDHSVLSSEPAGIKSKIGQKWDDLFEKPLFDKMLPALKLSYYNNLVESGLDGKVAAKTANVIFGGFNWEELGKSRDMQNLKKVLFLAPDWSSTNIDLGKNVVKSIANVKNPELAPYRKFAANFLGSYVLLNVINKANSGHFMFQNDPGHTFQVETGYTPDGQKRYFSAYGTAVDALRIPMDVANSLAKGDVQSVFRVIRNRLSIPAGVTVGALTDTDYAGKTIGYKGKDSFGNQMPLSQRAAGVGGEISQLFGLPSVVKQGIDTASGKQGLEQGLTQGMELPFRYSGGAYSGSQKQLAPLTNGMDGKQKYDLYNQVKGQSKFTDAQMEYLRSGDVKNNANDIILQRKINSSLRKGEAVPQELIDQIGNPTEVSAAETALASNDSFKVKVARTRVKSTGKEETVDGTLVYKNNDDIVKSIKNVNNYYLYKDQETGDYKKVAKTVDIKTPKISGNDLIDIPNFSSLSSKLASRKSDVVELYNAGLIGSDEATREITKFDAAQKLVKEIIKGLKATSSAKAGTVSKTKITKLRSLNAPLPRIKVSSPKSVKRVKLSTKRVSISVPKSKKLTPRRVSIK